MGQRLSAREGFVDQVCGGGCRRFSICGSRRRRGRGDGGGGVLLMIFHLCNLLVNAGLGKKRWIYLPLRPQIAIFSPGWMERVMSLRARSCEVSLLISSLLVDSRGVSLRSLYARLIKTSMQ